MLPIRLSLAVLALAVAGLSCAAPARADGPCAAPPPPSACEVVDACAPDPCASPWTLGIGLYLSAQSGNTDTLNFKGDFELVYNRAPWLWKLAGYYVYSEQDGERSSENGSLLLRGERVAGYRGYVFAQALYETDDFADLDYRLSPVAGYGRLLVKTSRTELKGEVGAGLSLEKRRGLEETTDPIAWLGAHYAQKLMKDALLRVDLDVRPNLNEFDRTVSVLDVKFECPLCKWMSLAVGLRLRHEVEPPNNLDELDTLLTVGLKLNF